MLERPAGITDDAVASVLRREWSSDAAGIEYAAVGFGSHHWTTERHFVTVDGASDADALRRALRTAHALRHTAGLGFVVAPVPADDGALVAALDETWVVHVYERLTVVDDTRFGRHEDPAVVHLVSAIHDATPVAASHVAPEDFSIRGRDALERAIADLGRPWDRGPHGAPARKLLARHVDDLVHVFAHHDEVARSVPRAGWVVTHGEPHRGNIFRTTAGWAVVDWDTALLAPAERDLWSLPTDRGDPRLTELYRLRWDLGEIAAYVSDFHGDHRGDRNDELGWRALVEHIDLRRRWPQLF